MRFVVPPSNSDTYRRLHFRRGGGDSSQRNPRCVLGLRQRPRETAGRLLLPPRSPHHGASRRHLGLCERWSRDAPTCRSGASRSGARRSAGFPRGAHDPGSTRLFHVQHWCPGMRILHPKSMRSFRLTMEDSHAHQNGERGNDGENEDQGSDRNDDGGVVDTCLGVVVIVRHDGLQWTASVWYVFKMLLAGRSLR